MIQINFILQLRSPLTFIFANDLQPLKHHDDRQSEMVVPGPERERRATGRRRGALWALCHLGDAAAVLGDVNCSEAVASWEEPVAPGGFKEHGTRERCHGKMCEKA